VTAAGLESDRPMPRPDTWHSVDAHPGDAVTVTRRGVLDAARSGVILEVLGESGRRHYRVRWDDGHVSLLHPGRDVVTRRRR
jgi:Domain of unknown function (DUF1918)